MEGCGCTPLLIRIMTLDVLHLLLLHIICPDVVRLKTYKKDRIIIIEKPD